MKRSFGVVVVALVASMTMAGMALAQDTEETTEREMLTPVVIVDEATGTVYVGLPPAEGQDPEECPPPDEPIDEGGEGGEAAEPPADIDKGEGEGDGDGEIVELVKYERGDCIEFMIENADGEINHGAIVSTVAKGLHPSMLEGTDLKKGEIMRCVAKYDKDDGKHCTMPVIDGEGAGDGDGGDGGQEPEVGLDKADKPAKGNSENAKNKDKPNKGKKNR